MFFRRFYAFLKCFLPVLLTKQRYGGLLERIDLSDLIWRM